MPGFEAHILPKRPLFPQEEKNTKYISAMERSLSCTIFALRKAFGPWDSVPSELVVPQRAATVPTPRTYCFDSLSPACHLAYLTLHIPDYTTFSPLRKTTGKELRYKGDGKGMRVSQKDPFSEQYPGSALSPEVSKIQTSRYPTPSMPTPSQEPWSPG